MDDKVVVVSHLFDGLLDPGLKVAVSFVGDWFQTKVERAGTIVRSVFLA